MLNGTLTFLVTSGRRVRATSTVLVAVSTVRALSSRTRIQQHAAVHVTLRLGLQTVAPHDVLERAVVSGHLCAREEKLSMTCYVCKEQYQRRRFLWHQQ